MSIEKNTDYKLLGTAAADILKLCNCKFALINTDDMSAALIDVTDKLECTVSDLYQGSAKTDFYQKAADSFPTLGADELFELCKNSKKSLIRYIKSAGVFDEQLKDGIYCKTLVNIYHDGYEQSVSQIINTVKSMVPEETKIVLTGKLAAFYPAEHTIKEAIAPMPFLPFARLYVSNSLTVDCKELIEKGKTVCERLQKERKYIYHNIIIHFKKLSGTKLVDWLYMLAKKGDDFEMLKNPKYSDFVIVHALDPISIFADSSQHILNLPRSLFAKGDMTAKVQFALGLENDIPKLLVKNEDRITMIDINTKIYSEV